MTPLQDDGHWYDTRQGGGRLSAGVPRTIKMGVTGKAITVNLIVASPDSSGFLSAWAGGTRPNTSKLNYSTGQSVANEVLIPLSPSGTIDVWSWADCHLIIDRVAVWS